MELDLTRELERDLDKIAQGHDTYGAVVARIHKRLEEALSQQRGIPNAPMAPITMNKTVAANSA